MYARLNRTMLPWLAVAGWCLASGMFAAEPEDELLQGAAQRIEQHRKADATMVVVDEAGQRLADVQISLQQTRHAFLFGCNFFAFGKFPNEADEAAYRRQFAELFNFATLAFYWPSYEPRQDQPNHAYTEEVARWCQDHGITTKGHPLAWNYFEPRWLPDDSAEIKQLQLARITDCVSRFRNLIDMWDVVNEATHFERDELKQRAPKMTKMWDETGRVVFVDECFQAARAANADATLLINDYRTDVQYVQLIEAMARQAAARPYDVIGIQSHMHGGVWNNQQIWKVCDRFAPFNVPLHFTEMTVLSGVPGWERRKGGETWDSTPEGEATQAREVQRIYTMLFSHPAVKAITWWDFADRYAWQGAPAGLINEDLQPKPAYNALLELVKNQWWTRLQVTTDAEGCAAFRGFLGDYIATVTTADGKMVKLPLTLRSDQPNTFQIVAGSDEKPMPLITTQNRDGMLEGWKFFCAEPATQCGAVWQFKDGVLSCRGTPKGYLYTEKEYSDFVLRLEWRWPAGKKAGSGGVLIRTTGPHKIWPRSLEAQINAGQAGDFWGLDGFQLEGPAERSKSLQHEQFGKLVNVAKSSAVEKPGGAWNQYEITARGAEVTLRINGEVVNRATRCDVAAGSICLTAEGDEIEFRNVELIAK